MTKKNDTGGTCYNLTITDLTVGKIIALTRALRYYNSPVGNDVLDCIRNAIHNSGVEPLETEIESSLQDLTNKMEKQMEKHNLHVYYPKGNIS